MEVEAIAGRSAGRIGMKTVISVAAIIVQAFSLDAQITATLNRLPDDSPEIRIRNNSAVSLAAFAISIKLANGASAAPLMVYVDPAIDMETKLLPPNQERTVMPKRMLSGTFTNGKMIYGFPILEKPIGTAGIFVDGTTTGDATLLARLVLRRSNMLAAVETALETLSDAGRHNVPRDQLIEQFKKMASSVSHWYLPAEQQVGRGLYESIIGKLMDLPEEPVGSPFPPTAFVKEETATLNHQRVTLLESQPSLADAALLHDPW
jgi:hypothetical protein